MHKNAKVEFVLTDENMWYIEESPAMMANMQSFFDAENLAEMGKIDECIDICRWLKSC